MNDEPLDRRVTRLEVQVSAYVAASAMQVQADQRLHESQSLLLEKLDRQMEQHETDERDAMERERDARVTVDTVEREARLSLASDFRVFATRILVGIAVVIAAAQFAIALLGPSLRHALGLPS